MRGRTEASIPAEMLKCLRRAACPHAAAMVRRSGHRPLRAVTGSAVGRADVGIGPYGRLQVVRWNGPSGKSAKRCQWQMKRAGFEEVPRLAATTVAGNRLARRWATAGPYECVTRRCGAGKNPPVTASPCQPPLGKGAEGTGMRIATAGVRTGFAMTGFCREYGERIPRSRLRRASPL